MNLAVLLVSRNCFCSNNDISYKLNKHYSTLFVYLDQSVSVCFTEQRTTVGILEHVQTTETILRGTTFTAKRIQNDTAAAAIAKNKTTSDDALLTLHHARSATTLRWGHQQPLRQRAGSDVVRRFGRQHAVRLDVGVVVFSSQTEG